MTKTIRILAAVALLSIAALPANPALARRTLAVGNAAFASTVSCFNFDYGSGTAGVGLNNTPSCKGFFLNPAWVVPLALDSTGAKTVSVTTKVTAANQMQCLLVEYNPAGTMLQAVVYPAFPVGGYATTAKSITVATGNSLSVLCGFNQNDANIGNARLMSVDY
jgi:hypothetical protein